MVRPTPAPRTQPVVQSTSAPDPPSVVRPVPGGRADRCSLCPVGGPANINSVGGPAVSYTVSLSAPAGSCSTAPVGPPSSRPQCCPVSGPQPSSSVPGFQWCGFAVPERFYRWRWLPGGCHPRARTPERSRPRPRPRPRPPAQPQVSPCSLCQSLTGPPEQCFPPNLPCLLGRPLGRPPELFNPPAKSSVHPPDILWFLCPAFRPTA